MILLRLSMHLKVKKQRNVRINNHFVFFIDATYSLFPNIPKQLSKFSNECHRFSFDVVFLPINSLLSGFSKSSVNEMF